MAPTTPEPFSVIRLVPLTLVMNIRIPFDPRVRCDDPRRRPKSTSVDDVVIIGRSRKASGGAEVEPRVVANRKA